LKLLRTKYKNRKLVHRELYPIFSLLKNIIINNKDLTPSLIVLKRMINILGIEEILRRLRENKQAVPEI